MCNNLVIPICCIAYNRVDSLKCLLESLNIAEYDVRVPLYISIDKSDTNDVEIFAESFNWKHGEKKVLKHDRNMGLRKHVLSCGNLLKEFDAIVVLEDDITVAESFYYYAQQCVEKYKYNSECAGISLYNFQTNYHNHLPFTPIHTDSDVYLMECAQSWGQVWMKDQWFEFKKWLEKNDGDFSKGTNLPCSISNWPQTSWLKFHTRYCIEKHKYFVYPYVSLSTNNGGAGTHNKQKSSVFQVPIQEGIKQMFCLTPTVRYDGFFENTKLAKYLEVEDTDLCVDLYGEKGNREKKRYWLTTKHLNYKIVKSFALELKPWEANVIHGRYGNDIFIYDTQIAVNNSWDKDCDITHFFYPLGLKNIFNILKKVISIKLNL